MKLSIIKSIKGEYGKSRFPDLYERVRWGLKVYIPPQDKWTPVEKSLYGKEFL